MCPRTPSRSPSVKVSVFAEHEVFEHELALASRQRAATRATSDLAIDGLGAGLLSNQLDNTLQVGQVNGVLAFVATIHS
jgi:hypothetical protein